MSEKTVTIRATGILICDVSSVIDDDNGIDCFFEFDDTSIPNTDDQNLKDKMDSDITFIKDELKLDDLEISELRINTVTMDKDPDRSDNLNGKIDIEFTIVHSGKLNDDQYKYIAEVIIEMLTQDAQVNVDIKGDKEYWSDERHGDDFDYGYEDSTTLYVHCKPDSVEADTAGTTEALFSESNKNSRKITLLNS